MPSYAPVTLLGVQTWAWQKIVMDKGIFLFTPKKMLREQKEVPNVNTIPLPLFIFQYSLKDMLLLNSERE